MNLTNRTKRDSRIIELRTQGYTYEAIARQLVLDGIDSREVSRVRVEFMLRRVAPELTGNIKRKLGLPKLIHKGDLDDSRQIADSGPVQPEIG